MIYYDSTCDALVRYEGDHTTVGWIRASLEGRVVAATLNGSSMRVAVSRGCPQGDVLSPLLWCLVDVLIARLSGGGIYIQGYADDICLLAVGEILNTVSWLVQLALINVWTWCNDIGLSVNPDKTEFAIFTTKRKLSGSFEPHFWGYIK